MSKDITHQESTQYQNYISLGSLRYSLEQVLLWIPGLILWYNLSYAHGLFYLKLYRFEDSLSLCFLIFLATARIFSNINFRLRASKKTFDNYRIFPAYFKLTFLILLLAAPPTYVLLMQSTDVPNSISELLNQQYFNPKFTWQYARGMFLTGPHEYAYYASLWYLKLLLFRCAFPPIPLLFWQSAALQAKNNRGWTWTVLWGSPVRFSLPSTSTSMSPPKPVVPAQMLTWADLILPESIIQQIRTLLTILTDPLQKRLIPSPPRGILLYGPPGTGKTQIARVIASVMNLKFFTLGTAEARGMYIGWGPARVKQIFTEARNNAPSIIFIDELDALAPDRSTGMVNTMYSDTVNELLQQMDGLGTPGVFVIAATNLPNTIDPAILRRLGVDPSTMRWAIHIPLPDSDCRERLLRLYLKDIELSDDFNLLSIVKLSDGLSADGIKTLCIQAGMEALKNQQTKVTTQDFMTALAC
jgi:ATPase family associated with various cellular activities (AAA)